jgi:ssDNA thymidine ADP-ribosyltransferase, DarT
VNATEGAGARGHLITHFTHVENVPGILADGCLRCDSAVDRDVAIHVEAADLGIKASRRAISVPLAPFGYVSDYVPFYFAPRSPMMFKLHKGSVRNYQEGQDPLIYLVSTVEAVVASNLRWLFSDGNCAHAFSQLFNDISRLDTAIDWDVMRARMWANTAEDPDRMRRRMAEFLVYERFPVRLLTGVVVRTPEMRDQVERQVTAHGVRLRVTVRSGWYF